MIFKPEKAWGTVISVLAEEEPGDMLKYLSPGINEGFQHRRKQRHRQLQMVELVMEVVVLKAQRPDWIGWAPLLHSAIK